MSVASTGGSVHFLTCDHCGSRHFGKCRHMRGKCFGCGAVDHFIKNCPNAPGIISVPSTKSGASPSRGKSSGSSFGIGQEKRVPSEVGSRTESGAPARAYAMRAREGQDALDVINVMFKLFDFF